MRKQNEKKINVNQSRSEFCAGIKEILHQFTITLCESFNFIHQSNSQFQSSSKSTIMTKSLATKGSANRKKKNNFLRNWIRRKNCIYCFIINIILALGALAGIIVILIMLKNTKRDIGVLELRKERLEGRSEFEAFFGSECPLYPKQEVSATKFNYEFCNRYCEGNHHMEFMHRHISLKGKMMKNRDDLQCPDYVDLRPCQSRRHNYYCARKKFILDYVFKVSKAEPSKTYMGICASCPGPTTQPAETHDHDSG